MCYEDIYSSARKQGDYERDLKAKHLELAKRE
jgi:hypothetical protein